MEIVEYDQIDPLKAMMVPRLALDFAMTPELVRHLRQTDPRPFPYLALYAVDGEAVMGQVGVFRLPMVTTEGREDVGGIWAVSTHPQYAGRGVASALMLEAHSRMRAEGLRFSTLGTDRFRSAHRLYRRHGYEDMGVWATALARWETAHQPTRLRAELPGADGYDFIEEIFAEVAKGYLGFAWRHTPFARLRRVSLTDIWILRETTQVVGYALAQSDGVMLSLSNLVLEQGIDAAEAVSAVAAQLKAAFVEAKLSRPVEIASLKKAGYEVAHPSWSAFMVKPLIPEVTADEARRLFGIGSDRFLISWLDVT